MTVQAASGPMCMKVFYQRLWLPVLLQPPDGVVHRVAEDHRVDIEGDKPAAGMSCYSNRKDNKEQRSDSSHCRAHSHNVQWTTQRQNTAKRCNLKLQLSRVRVFNYGDLQRRNRSNPSN